MRKREIPSRAGGGRWPKRREGLGRHAFRGMDPGDDPEGSRSAHRSFIRRHLTGAGSSFDGDLQVQPREGADDVLGHRRPRLRVEVLG